MSTAKRKRRDRRRTRKPAAAAVAPGTSRAELRWLSGGTGWLLLLAVSFVTYVNAWPDSLVLDDRIFVERALTAGIGPAEIARFFTEDLWAATGTRSDLYRPLLLLFIGAQAAVFGNWLTGYYLVNILLHVLATATVYVLLHRVLTKIAPDYGQARPLALLAALTFGTHPVHAEVVNSVFNSSEMLVTIGTTGGLAWFLQRVDRRPALAWAGLGVIYLLVLLCRESGAALPALAGAVLWLTASGPWRSRLLRCLPVLAMVVPLALYLALRAEALEAPPRGAAPAAGVPAADSTQSAPAGGPVRLDPGSGLEDLLVDFHPRRLLPAVSLWFESLRHLAWPYPLQIYYDPPSTPAWLAAGAQLVLLAGAISLAFTGRPLLLLGLAFFYLSLLPSSRLFGPVSAAPGLADRLLYLPSVGITFMVAAGLLPLARRLGLRAAALGVMLAVLVMLPLTWARNSDWTRDSVLFEADYARLNQKEPILNTLLGAHLREQNTRRVVEICDAHAARFGEAASWGIHCGQAYGEVGRFADAERAFRSAARSRDSKAYAHMSLGMLYLQLDRLLDAQLQFERAIEAERLPFLKEYFTAVALIRMHPNDRSRLLQARSHLERALELQPQHTESRRALTELERRLGGPAR